MSDREVLQGWIPKLASEEETRQALELAFNYRGDVAITLKDGTKMLVSRTLKARDFIVDYRPPVGIRISPHFYNTMDELDRVMAEIASIVATRDYAADGQSSLVT